MKERTFDIAKTFGMNVTQLCDITGYTRQALGSIIHRDCGVGKRRWNVAMNALASNIQEKYQDDIDKAEESLTNRLNLLDELRKLTKE